VSPVILVRHASAGKPEAWRGDDRERPLDERGRQQADGLVSALAPYDIQRILSSPYLRCVQTVEPLAVPTGLGIEERDELAEGATRETVLALIDELSGASAALCTHGDVVLALLGEEMKKGAAAVLERHDAGVRVAKMIPRQA
jgi:phosphohistidine phosphatase SixA